jgi:putative peptidoglycan lipid II flippase
MTTPPGHQAGPTPANGRPAPGAGHPRGEDTPAAGRTGRDRAQADDARGPDAPEGAHGGYGGPGSVRGPHGPPHGAEGRYGAPEDDDGWYGPPGGGHGPPDSRYPGYGSPDNGYGAPPPGYGGYGAPGGDYGGYADYGGPGGGYGQYAGPDNGYPGYATPQPGPGGYGAPDAAGRSHGDYAAYGGAAADDSQNTARMSRPETQDPPRARHAADAAPPDPSPPDATWAGPAPPGPARAQAARPDADWIEARWTGADRGQAAAAPAAPAAWDPGSTRAIPAIDAELPGGAADSAGTAGAGEAAAPANASLLRSSSVMAVGTIASRVTGFVRSAILIYAIGTHDLGNAYNLANTLPNIVYNLALGGILTSVVVPLLVNAAKRDRDRGEAYDQRIFTLGVLALGAITLVATLAAQPIASVYAGNIGSHSAYRVTVLFAYFFIPQIFFYGVSSLAGAILNARGSFAAPMWTPVINNLVVIVVGLAFMLTAGLNRTAADISPAQIELLGIGTTLGIVLQTVALIPSLRRVGFRWRPRRDFRRAEVSEIGHMSGWMFGYVLTTQIAFLVTTRVANAAGARVSQAAAGAGIAAYSNAYMLFQLPYAIVGISVITALLPRMSAHAAERKYGQVSSDFSTAVRLAAVIVVPAALILAVLGAPLAEGVFGYGSTSIASARYVGEIFAVFSLGLLPFTLFQLLLRVFYSMHDSRTPALISVITMVINIVANVIALAVLPPQHVVAGLGAGFGLASLAGTIAAWRVLSRRIGGLDGQAIGSGLVRMHAAAIPGAVFAIAVAVMVGAVIPGGRIAALLTVAIGGCGAMLLYALFAKAFGVAELADLTATVRSRLR